MFQREGVGLTKRGVSCTTSGCKDVSPLEELVKRSSVSKASSSHSHVLLQPQVLTLVQNLHRHCHHSHQEHPCHRQHQHPHRCRPPRHFSPNYILSISLHPFILPVKGSLGLVGFDCSHIVGHAEHQLFHLNHDDDDHGKDNEQSWWWGEELWWYQTPLRLGTWVRSAIWWLFCMLVCCRSCLYRVSCNVECGMLQSIQKSWPRNSMFSFIEIQKATKETNLLLSRNKSKVMFLVQIQMTQHWKLIIHCPTFAVNGRLEFAVDRFVSWR